MEKTVFKYNMVWYGKKPFSSIIWFEMETNRFKYNNYGLVWKKPFSSIIWSGMEKTVFKYNMV